MIAFRPGRPRPHARAVGLNALRGTDGGHSTSRVNSLCLGVELSFRGRRAGARRPSDITLSSMGVSLPRAEVVTFSVPVCRLPMGLVIDKKGSDNYVKLADLEGGQEGQRHAGLSDRPARDPQIH